MFLCYTWSAAAAASPHCSSEGFGCFGGGGLYTVGRRLSQMMLKSLESVRDRLKTHASTHSNIFQHAKPFSHVVIDNFFEESHAFALAKELGYSSIINQPGWNYYEHDNTKRWRLEDDLLMPPKIRELAWFVNSRYFILFIESLTGISSLIGDPYFIGGGAMASQQGGFLNMHVDFNWHHKLQLWRHLNFIVYLTPGWQTDWKGQLVLECNDHSSKAEIEPRFNRAVLFRVDDTCFHGQPEPLTSPAETLRTLFSSFYYCNAKPEKTSSEPHFTKYSLENSSFAKALNL